MNKVEYNNNEVCRIYAKPALLIMNGEAMNSHPQRKHHQTERNSRKTRLILRE